MKKMIFLVMIVLSSIACCSQICVVNIDSIKGNYTGECRNGKAEGEGTATGVDSYTGTFKNGYPEGEGKYTWKNGDWYEGNWKRGNFDGKGVLWKSYRPDSAMVLRGYWKSGKYIGLYEKPYIIHKSSTNITRVDIQKLNINSNEITLQVKNITSGASNLSHLVLPKTRLVNIQVIEGRYENQIPDESSSSLFNKYVLKKVSFPFRAIFYFDIDASHNVEEQVDVELLENCHWQINVNVDN